MREATKKKKIKQNYIFANFGKIGSKGRGRTVAQLVKEAMIQSPRYLFWSFEGAQVVPVYPQ